MNAAGAGGARAARGVRGFRFAGERIAACRAGAGMLGLPIQLGVVASPWPPE